MGEATDVLLEMQARAVEGDPDLAAEAGMDEALHAERNRIWTLQAEAWLDEQPQGSLFTADDLQAAIGKPEPDKNGRSGAAGAWINAQARRRRIESTGRKSKSRRVEGHGNEQTLWRVKDGQAGRVGGGVGRLGPVGVSSNSSAGSGLKEASAGLGPHPPAGVSLNPDGFDGPSAAVGDQAVSSSAAEHGELERAAEDFVPFPCVAGAGLPCGECPDCRAADEADELCEAPPGGLPEMGEQLGLLGTAGATPGAYSEAAA